jgi:hypothetical protein
MLQSLRSASWAKAEVVIVAADGPTIALAAAEQLGHHHNNVASGAFKKGLASIA